MAGNGPKRTRRPRGSGAGKGKEPASSSKAGGEPEARIRELEAELAAAHKTIRALLDKAEERALESSQGATAYEAAARMEELLEERTRGSSEEESLSDPSAEVRDLSPNLEDIVRQRTRALYESEEQLRRKNEELKRMNAMKGEFISIAAHELRTPMTSIVGYLDLMSEGRFGKLSKRLERPVAALRRNAQRLSRLVEEMLDVSRLESGRMAINPEPCRLAEIVRDVVEELTPFSAINRQTLETEMGSDPVIHADADKIHQVVAALTGSAIRYTPDEGKVTIAVDEAPEEQFVGEWARLRVRDNGLGIPASLRARIFEPFSDAHTAKHHTSSGPDSAGLGLYIARGLVDLHGGLITVDSREGEFTEFTVLLPLALT